MKFAYVSVDGIFTKFERDLGKDFNEDDIIEWTGEALNFMNATQISEEVVAFIEVKNHQAEVPRGVQTIRQMAKNNRWTPVEDGSLLCPAKVIPETPTEDCPEIPKVLDCYGVPINAGISIYRPYFDVSLKYGSWFSNDYYHENYSPIRPQSSALYDSLVCKDNINNYGLDTYSIIKKQMMRFSFKDGSVALAYTRGVVDDETGYPMIPDDISFTTAIVAYVNYKMCSRDFYNGRQGAEGRLAKSEQDWNWYCGQATNKAKMPHGEDEFQRLYESRNYMIPLQRYYSYFGNNNARRLFRAANSTSNIYG